jgi:hypothetical protein
MVDKLVEMKVVWSVDPKVVKRVGELVERMVGSKVD